jgi:hypothetical protein
MLSPQRSKIADAVRARTPHLLAQCLPMAPALQLRSHVDARLPRHQRHPTISVGLAELAQDARTLLQQTIFASFDLAQGHLGEWVHVLGYRRAASPAQVLLTQRRLDRRPARQPATIGPRLS